MSLKQISKDIQNSIETYSRLLSLDIVVIDDSLFQLAATGIYRISVGEKVSKNSIFPHVIELGRTQSIHNPRQCDLCSKCEKIEKCSMKVIFCYPLKYDGKTIGVLSVIGTNYDQKSKMLFYDDELNILMENLAAIILSKLKDEYYLDDFELLNLELSHVFQLINYGIIITDKKGFIKNINPKAYKDLSISSDMIGNNITNIVGNIDLSNLIFENNRDIKHRFKHSNFSGIYTIDPILKNSVSIGYVFMFAEMNLLKASNLPIDTVITLDTIIGKSKEITEVKNIILKVSKTDSNVILYGESGTGKELFARAIHFISKRKYKPFIPVNCAAIPDSLLESELFGYVDGAFTGAQKKGKRGKFELANNGTIFLDEIGDMQLHLQAKLLRVLQDGLIERVGSENLVPVNARIIAATNHNLISLINENKFREDLFYRLNVVPITLPPLRERKEDILLIAKAFLDKYNNSMKKIVIDFDKEVKSLFINHYWKGNIRELENVVEYCMNVDEDNIIRKDDLPPHFFNNDLDNLNFKILPLKEIENREIHRALDHFGNTKKGIAEASDALGISISTIYRRLRESM